MVYLQIISREGFDVQASVRAAIEEERIKSFEIERIRGGLRIRHRKFKGSVRFLRTDGPSLIAIRSPDATKEWQLLEKVIGRLVYHFAGDIAGINIQLHSAQAVGTKPRRARPKKARRKQPAARRRAVVRHR